MSNGKTALPPPSLAYYDFYKTNGTKSSDHEMVTVGPSMTRQEFAAECDINNIMKQYDGYLADPARTVRDPVYYDFTSMPDNLMDAMAVMHEAESAFMRLPANVRREFDNDAAMFADYASDPANLEQMREWGLGAPVKPAEPPVKVEVISAPPAPPPEPAAS